MTERRKSYRILTDKEMEAGLFKLFRSEAEDGSYWLEPIEPTDSWESGYNEGYRDGLEAGVQFHGVSSGT